MIVPMKITHVHPALRLRKNHETLHVRGFFPDGLPFLITDNASVVKGFVLPSDTVTHVSVW